MTFTEPKITVYEIRVNEQKKESLVVVNFFFYSKIPIKEMYLWQTLHKILRMLFFYIEKKKRSAETEKEGSNNNSVILSIDITYHILIVI